MIDMDDIAVEPQNERSDTEDHADVEDNGEHSIAQAYKPSREEFKAGFLNYGSKLDPKFANYHNKRYRRESTNSKKRESRKKRVRESAVNPSIKLPARQF